MSETGLQAKQQNIIYKRILTKRARAELLVSFCPIDPQHATLVCRSKIMEGTD